MRMVPAIGGPTTVMVTRPLISDASRGVVSGLRDLPQNASQNSARNALPCLTVISWGESDSEAFSATGAIDQITAATAMVTIAVRIIILRISGHLCVVMSLRNCIATSIAKAA